MSKVAIHFETDQGLKDAFFQVSEEMHTTPTDLLNLLMNYAVKHCDVNLLSEDNEIEPLDTSDWGDDFNNKIEALHSRMDAALAKARL